MSDLSTYSHSQLSSWDRCEQAWAFSYLGKWTPKKKKNNLAIGTIVHEFEALLYKHVFEGGKSLEALELIEAHARKILSDQREDIYGDTLENVKVSLKMMKRYIEDYIPFEDDFEIKEIEQKREVILTTPAGRQFILVFIPDRLIEKGGKLWLWETKTVGQGRFWTDTELLMDSQQPTYLAALRELGFDVFGIVFNMLNTYDYKDYANTHIEKLFRREKTYRTPAELDNIIYNIGRQVDEIEEKTSDPTWTPIKSLRRDCDRCFFQEPCLRSVKGFPVEQVLSASFIKKESPNKEEELNENEAQ